jgi:hypothetical protein
MPRQVSVASSPAGYAIMWQEDPDGLRPGDGAGPGHGWSGATTNHKTDVWYSYITMEDFYKMMKILFPVVKVIPAMMKTKERPAKSAGADEAAGQDIGQ